MKILVTGATGFIGRHLIRRLAEQGKQVRAVYRSGDPRQIASSPEWIQISESDGSTDWSRALDGVTHVVHLAGIAHRMGEDERVLQELFDRVNRDGTKRLAEAIAASSVQKFVYMSSCKAAPNPGDAEPDSAYGKSKREAEDAIAKVLAGTKVRWVALRPALVYGPGNTGNMAKLIRLIESGAPLPFASIGNRRSFLYIENLLDVIERCLSGDIEFGQRLFVTDGRALSTAELVRMLASAMGRNVHLMRFPVAGLRALAKVGDVVKAVAGRSPGIDSYSVDRLISSSEFSNEEAEQALGWKPRFTTEEGLRRTFGAEERSESQVGASAR